MKTLIAIPCMDTMPVQFAQSMSDLIMDRENTRILYHANSLIYDSRNLITFTALKEGFDYVMWFDSDMVFAPATMQVLLKDAQENNYDMVSGLYFKRRIPITPVIYNKLQAPEQHDGKLVKQITTYDDYPHDSIFEIEGCGFGCVLTSVPLLQRVVDQFGIPFNPFPWAGEDLSFCYRVQQTGTKMYCDSRVKCGHVGQIVYSEAVYNNTRSEQK